MGFRSHRDEFWHKLGLRLATWADSTFLYGVGQLLVDVHQLVETTARQRAVPLNWAYPFQELYVHQDAILWVQDQEHGRTYLPQVVLVGPHDLADETDVGLQLAPQDFQPPYRVSDALDYYRIGATGRVARQFFDGENARLLDWNPCQRLMIFQGCSYFDYLQTNLALDMLLPLPIGSTLREQTVVDGRIEPLRTSKLANTTGINGLLFASDGYMVFQRRTDNVMIRPRELCSGFSGTVDKIDINHAIAAGGRLSHLDAPREMVEELGIQRREIRQRHFLGITRELIRGGAPEMFYAIDVDLSADEIVHRIPRDHEGIVKTVFLGPYARSIVAPADAARLPESFWRLVEAIQSSGSGPMSIPLLTNLILWYQRACPAQAGADRVIR